MSLNVKKSSIQRIFEYGLKAIRKQGSPAMEGYACKYLDSIGRKCVVGQMLTEEQQAAVMAAGIGSIDGTDESRKFFVSAFDIKVGRKKWDLLMDMQSAHDSAARENFQNFLEAFEAGMQHVGRKHGLRYRPPVETLRT